MLLLLYKASLYAGILSIGFFYFVLLNILLGIDPRAYEITLYAGEALGTIYAVLGIVYILIDNR